MSEDRIIISFDDEPAEEKNENSSPERIIEKSGNENEKIDSGLKKSVNILNSTVNYSFGSDNNLSAFSESELKYPEGTERGFNRNSLTDLKDNFFSNILYNNKYIILSSKKSIAYFIERIANENIIQISMPGNVFEKTGCVVSNDVYLNSLTEIICLNSKDIPERKNLKTIYTAPENYYVWTNLNTSGDKLAFCIYNNLNEAVFILIDRFTGGIKYKFNFNVERYLSDCILVDKNKYFVFADNFYLYIEENSSGEFPVRRVELKFNITPETKFIILKDKMYINDHEGSIYYQDLKSGDTTLHYTGIRIPYLNSIAGFDDFIFAGHTGGWKAFDINGVQIFSHNDIEENKIETLNKNILVVSRFNKVIFHNLNRFQEAEGFAVSGAGKNKADIISAVFADDEILALTAGGMLESYSNKRLNINI